MTSPGARQRRRREQYQSPRSRAEVRTGIGVAVAIVAATGLMIWLLRPGGLADRQPRSSWLVGFVVIASVVLLYEVLRPKTPVKKLSRRVSLGGGFAIIAVLALLGVWKWPGGLIRHTPSLAAPPTVPTANPVTSTSGSEPSTTAPGATQTTTSSP